MSVAQDSALDTNDGSTTDRYIVEVQGISKFYEPDTQALLDVDLGFPEGEMTTLLGPSGCGKTTLLKLLTGLIKPDAGQVSLRGQIGALIALGAGFNPILTARENIFINASILGISKRETARRLDDIVDFAGGDGLGPSDRPSCWQCVDDERQARRRFRVVWPVRYDAGRWKISGQVSFTNRQQFCGQREDRTH